MKVTLFDSGIVGNTQAALDSTGNILESPSEYSVIGNDLDGKIMLWNEGARRLYGYEPDEVVGRASTSILHTPEDVRAGKQREIMKSAWRDGKWEGVINCIRKNGERFTARVVITLRMNTEGKPISFLIISKDITTEIRPELVHCQDALDEVAHILRPLAEAKGLHFEVIVPVTKVIIQTDRRALTQVLLNLTTNAIKFTETGSVSIELRRRMDGELIKVSTEFNVEDTGMGIRPDEQTRFFQAFEQPGSSGTRRYEGTGLGLYRSQKLAVLLGGRIEMMSTYGQGSIFRLVIPEK